MATVTGSQRQLAHTSDTYTSNGNITVGGNLEVQGTTTTIDTANLLVEDKNIVIGNVTTPTDTTADGGGITLKGATDKTLNWVDSTDSWTSSETFSAPNLSLTSLSSGASATTALMLNGTTVVTRALGSAAFSNTSAFAAAGDENIIDGATSIWNADGDGDVFAYDDSNPTHNGKYVGAIIDIRGDGASTSSLVKAGIFTSNHVSTTDGYYVGTILGATNSSTTQVINSSGEWTGAVIPSAKLDTDTAHLSGTQTFTGNKTFNYNVSDLDSVGGQAGVTPFKSQFQATNRAGSGNYNTGLEFTFHDTTARGQLVFGSDGNNVIPAIYARTEGWSGNNGWHDWYELWHSGNDGTGSGLDADTVDGIQASSFLRSDANDSATGIYTFTNTVYFGTNPSNPGRIEIADNSTTDYKLRILGTGTRAFELQGSGSTADFNTSFTNAGTGSHHISVAGNITVGGTVDGRDVASDGSKLDGIAAGANNYSHPTHPGDDISIDTGALTGATVISDLDFNVTTDTLGHVTDANAAISTRNLTYSDVGAAASSHSHDDRYYTETEVTNHFKTLAFQGNYMNTYQWSTDSSGSVDSGWGGLGTVPYYPNGSFGQNGVDAENTRSISELPNGAYGVVWRTPSSDADSGADGGWNCNINGVQDSKLYRSVIYFRRTADVDAGTFYHGCSSSDTANISDATNNTNPYFHNTSIDDKFVVDRWYVSVGYIQPYQSGGGTNSARSGIYDCVTGKKIISGSDFMMKSGSTNQQQRTYIYYTTNTATEGEWWGPRFEEVNGNEPSIRELIAKGADGELGMTIHSKFDPATLDQLTEASDAADDKFLLWDQSAGNWKYIRMDDLQDSIDTNTTYNLGSFGITATSTELNYTDGVTSNIQTQLNAKAALASPALTGVPTAPTAAANTNTTQIATTAYVQTEITDLIGGAPGALDTLNELAAAINDDSSYASTVTTALAGKLNLSGGTLTGTLTSRDILLASGYHLQRGNHHTGHLEGSYNNIGANGSKTNPIYTIGSSYNPGENTLSDMYGIGYSHTDATFISFTGASGWGQYVAADGDARIFLCGSNGVISSTGEHYVGSNKVFHDGYHPNADTLTTARNIALTGAVTGNANFDGSGNISIATTATSDPTLTINGDASGSATFTNLGNATLTLTIADDSHNHTIANVDGLQTALDGKQASGTYNTIIGTDSDINTSGSTIIDNIYVTDGVITSMGTRTLAASDISALTQSDFEELLWQNTGRIFSPMNNPLRYSSSGTTGGLDGVCFTRAEVTSTASAWAQNCLTRTTTNEISWSGGGTEFSRKLGASFKCAFVASGTQAQSIRFMFGGRANSVQAAGSNPLASKGFGVEFRSRTGTTVEWRVIAHDGVYFSASGWSDIPSNTTGNYLKELYIYSDGSGNISAGLDDRGGDGSSWTTKTTTGGPTGNGNSTYPYLVNEVINASSGSSYARSRIYDYKIFSE
jgi:hypothetical protein